MQLRKYKLAIKYFSQDIYPLHNALEQYIYVLCGSHDLACDVVSDVMAMAWRKIFDVHSKRDPRQYLMRCAQNRLIDYLRDSGHAAYIEDPGALADQAKDIISQLIRAEEIKLLFDAIAKLTVLERRIILMFYIYDETLSDIAKFTRLPVSTVATLKRRTLAKLRADIGPLLIVLLRLRHPKKLISQADHSGLAPSKNSINMS